MSEKDFNWYKPVIAPAPSVATSNLVLIVKSCIKGPCKSIVCVAGSWEGGLEGGVAKPKIPRAKAGDGEGGRGGEGVVGIITDFTISNR